VREQAVRIPLHGIRLPEVRTGADVALGELPGTWLLTLIRHRF
jgi:hypothetical protein